MALITCKECSKDYSNKAPSCPNCGCPTEYNDKSEKSDDLIECVECRTTYSVKMDTCPECGCPSVYNVQNDEKSAFKEYENERDGTIENSVELEDSDQDYYSNGVNVSGRLQCANCDTYYNGFLHEYCPKCGYSTLRSIRALEAALNYLNKVVEDSSSEINAHYVEPGRSKEAEEKVSTMDVAIKSINKRIEELDNRINNLNNNTSGLNANTFSAEYDIEGIEEFDATGKEDCAKNKTGDDIRYKVILLSAGQNKPYVLREIMKLKNAEWSDVGHLADFVPVTIFLNLSKQEADKIKDKLDQTGATIELQHDTNNGMPDESNVRMYKEMSKRDAKESKLGLIVFGLIFLITVFNGILTNPDYLINTFLRVLIASCISGGIVYAVDKTNNDISQKALSIIGIVSFIILNAIATRL